MRTASKGGRTRKTANEVLRDDRIAVQHIVVSDLLAEHNVTDPVERSKILRAYMLWAINQCASEQNLTLMHKFLRLASEDVQAGILPAPPGTSINVVGAMTAPTTPRGASVPVALPPMSPALQELALAALPTGDESDDIQDAEVVE